MRGQLSMDKCNMLVLSLYVYQLHRRCKYQVMICKHLSDIRLWEKLFFYRSSFVSVVSCNARSYLSTELSLTLPTRNKHIVFCDVLTNILVELYGKFEGA